MKLSAFILVIFLISCSQQEKTATSSPVLSIIPLPASITTSNGSYELSKEVTISSSTEDEKNVADFLVNFLQLKNINATVTSGEADIVIKTVSEESIGKEGYKLDVNKDGVQIEANNGAGLFYGVQTLFQLISSDGNKVPFVQIADEPRFSYRGLHLDVGRNMFPIDFIKKYIDMMSHYKYNNFHWHLTEDQGWRIEIKKYPKLQEVSAFRNETVIGHARDSKEYDGKRYGGYYTQEEIKDVIAYATERYITIIPEIEMPGHALAALAAYPYLGCTGGPYETGKTWGVFDDVYCAGKETTFEFLENVLDEVVELFPSKYVHIGGDESPKVRWEKCPNCQKRIKTEKLKDEHELQSYFIQRMEKYLGTKGKSIIGWDEILEGGLAPNATVMSWRGEEGGIQAAQQHHNVIMTPVNWCYFDYYQADPETEPFAIGSLTTVEETYSYEPLPAQLSPEEGKYILGAQGNLWTEYITTGDYAEYMVYPRAIALAEVVWSPKNSRNYDNFVDRMKGHRNLMDHWKINYAKHIFEVKPDSIK
jgi:hexosaminidase